MRFLQSIMGMTGLLSLQSPQTSNELTPSLPFDQPAFIQLSAWLTAINTADPEIITAYHTELNFPTSILGGVMGGIEREFGLALMTGGFEIVKVDVSDEPSFVSVILQDRKLLRHFRANMTVDTSQQSYPATNFQIRSIITPLELIPEEDPRRPAYEKALAPLTASRRRAVIDGFSEVLREQYVKPTVSERIIAALDTHLKNGDYDDVEESERFSERLVKDIHAAGNDKHMFIIFIEPRPEMNSSNKDRPVPQDHLEDLKPMNFGFGKISFDTQSVPGRSIATLPIDAFIPSDAKFASDWEQIRAAIGDILSASADADALIVDLRSNHGGSPCTVAFILSYLLDGGPLHLLDMVSRNGTIEQSFSTLNADELPPGTKRFGGKKPLYVLTTNETISGGEDMAYSLQAFNRAEAIIGEGNGATAGSANPIGNARFVGEEIFGKGWWWAGVPSLEPVHAVTGSNWEGVGVKSDIITGTGEWKGESDAKEVARKLAIRALQPNKEL